MAGTEQNWGWRRAESSKRNAICLYFPVCIYSLFYGYLSHSRHCLGLQDGQIAVPHGTCTVCVPACVWSRINKYPHTHTYIHTCMHTCVHAYIHTYIQEFQIVISEDRKIKPCKRGWRSCRGLRPLCWGGRKPFRGGGIRRSQSRAHSRQREAPSADIPSLGGKRS